MKVKDLLEVLWTDSIVLARGQKILTEIETVHIEQALEEYMDEEINRIVPLDNAIEINLKE